MINPDETNTESVLLARLGKGDKFLIEKELFVNIRIKL